MSTIEQEILEAPDIYKYLQNNVDLIIEIFSKPELWDGLHKRIYKEYKDDPKYIECSVKYKTLYKALIPNDLDIYFKLTKYDNISRKFEYKTGLNIDTNEFNPSGCCTGGGLYFCKLEDLYQFRSYGDYLTPIIIPKDIPVYQESHTEKCNCNNEYKKLKAPCVYALPRFRIDNQKINYFLTESSPNNKKFINFTLYKTINKNFLMEYIKFIRDTDKLMYYWYDEYKLAYAKFEILNDIFFDFQHLLHYGKKDKFILNYIINTGLPKILEKKKINPIKSLNLDSSDYVKCFLDKEIEIFSKFNFTIAGSNVLRFITNNSFIPNDIDLYININDYNEFIKTNDFIIKNNEKTKFYAYNMKNILNIVDIKIKCEIKNKYGYPRLSWKNYQLIVVENNPIQFIKENFDFDLCAITFDFATKSFVNLIDKPDYSVLSIQPSYINKMTGTEIDSYSKYRASKTIGRINKYIERGFQVENWKEFLIEVRDNICDY